MGEAKRMTLLDYAPVIFWPAWALVAVLQALDVVSVGLAGRLVREVNPVTVHLMAHYGAGGAMLIKALAVVSCLSLLVGLFDLAERVHSRALAAVCLVVAVLGALYSAIVFWNTVASALHR